MALACAALSPCFQPDSMATRRKDAMRLLSQLGEVEERLGRLRDGLRALLDEDG